MIDHFLMIEAGRGGPFMDAGLGVPDLRDPMDTD